jgi:hypothetical protein
LLNIVDDVGGSRAAHRQMSHITSPDFDIHVTFREL